MDKIEIIKNLKQLKNILEYMESKVEENTFYKPLDQKEIDLIETVPTQDYIKSAYLYTISEKIKNLVKKNKLSSNYKTLIANDKIIINFVKDLNSYNVIKLDLGIEPPQLESTIYNSKNEISKEIDFSDFIKLRNILEDELGIKIDSNENSSIENIIEQKVYTIGNKYSIKYIRKLKNPNK